MKVKVVISFHDAANFALIHNVGDELEVPEERAQRLVDLGLVKKVEGKKAEEPKDEPTSEEPVENAPEVSDEKPKRRRSRR